MTVVVFVALPTHRAGTLSQRLLVKLSTFLYADCQTQSHTYRKLSSIAGTSKPLDCTAAKMPPHRKVRSGLSEPSIAPEKMETLLSWTKFPGERETLLRTS